MKDMKDESGDESEDEPTVTDKSVVEESCSENSFSMDKDITDNTTKHNAFKMEDVGYWVYSPPDPDLDFFPDSLIFWRGI